MKLTGDNYFSLEANARYLSVSQYKSFLACEAKTLAGIKGEYISTHKTEALMFGSLLHKWNEGEEAFIQFQTNNPDLRCKTGKNKGELKASYKKVYTLIDKINKDKLFQKALEGEKEIIFTTEMFGIDWKICIDSYNPDAGYFTDLKAVASLHDTYWNHDYQKHVDFITHYKYDFQMVIYAEIERLANKRSKPLTPYLACITKQEPPASAIYKGFLNYREVILEEVEKNVSRIIDLKNGIVKPKYCGFCEYCRSVKETEIIEYIK